jgi:hypothetical protein
MGDRDNYRRHAAAYGEAYLFCGASARYLLDLAKYFAVQSRSRRARPALNRGYSKPIGLCPQQLSLFLVRSIDAGGGDEGRRH